MLPTFTVTITNPKYININLSFDRFLKNLILILLLNIKNAYSFFCLLFPSDFYTWVCARFSVLKFLCVIQILSTMSII